MMLFTALSEFSDRHLTLAVKSVVTPMAIPVVQFLVVNNQFLSHSGTQVLIKRDAVQVDGHS